ncbi:hypothetical protein [Micromonospora craterilacus]|nr:hypothetical protein [Micromonospora craterilacus]
MVEMATRRWVAGFEAEHLVLRRRRLLPWPKADLRRIPLTAVLDIGSLTAADHARRRAQLSVQDPASPHLTEAIPVRFTPQQWEHAGWFVRQRQAMQTGPPQPGASPTQSSRSLGAPATPVMRAGDGKRPVWLWLQDGKIHASLAPVGNTSPRSLSPADVAQLLLADPSRAMPAIRAVTGIADGQQALACLRGWWQSDRVVVNLSAADLAGRRVTEALRTPGRSNPDGSVRTVSGGLPSLNKRRR